MAKKSNSELISVEVATTDVEKWLNHRKVSDSRRAICAISIKHLVFAVMEGSLVLNEDFSFTQKLKFAIGDTAELIYKPRLTVDEVQVRLNQVNPSDNDRIGQTICYVAALTNTVVAIAKKMDSEDFRIADHLCFFFMG